MVTIRIPNYLVNITLSVVGLVVTLGVFELGGRIWLNYWASAEDYRSYALYKEVEPKAFLWSPHHYLNYYPSPNYNKDLTVHNSLGYRGDEFPLKKPEGVYRIVALGESAIYTEKVKDNSQTFTARLETILRQDYGYQNVQVINAGVPGYTTWESLINLEFRVLDLEPDLVIIYHNTNDVHTRLVEPAAYRGDNSGYRRQWREPAIKWWEYSTILRILSRKLDITEQVRLDNFVEAPTLVENTGSDPTSTLQQNPPIYFRRNLSNMIAIARENNIKVMMATWAYSPGFGDYASRPYYQQAYAEQNQVILEIGRSHEVPVFDYEAVMSQSPEYWADGRHVNEAGALLKAQLFAKFIHDLRVVPVTGPVNP